MISFYAARVSWTEDIDKALNKTKDSAYALVNLISYSSQFTSMYARFNFRYIAIFSIISTVLIYIVSYIFCFCEVIFESRIVLKYSIDPTNINIHYLFWIYCSMVLLETFQMCRVGGWLGGWIN